MTKYIYGASIQGIQDFIFSTGKLTEIAGASEFIEDVCQRQYEIFLNGGEYIKLLSAAGNIRLIAESKDVFKDIVSAFPKSVMQQAPSVIVSQAVVEFTENENLNDVIKKLEKKLLIQLNKASTPTEPGFMILERCRNTGNVAITKDEEDYLCTDSLQKRFFSGKNINRHNLPDFEERMDRLQKRSVFGKRTDLYERFTGTSEGKNLFLNFEDLEKYTGSSWMAVIHADGNRIGDTIKTLGEYYNQTKEFQKHIEAFQYFSTAITMCTQNAAQAAYREVERLAGKNNERLFMRPILLGGDDITVVLSSAYAFEFACNFITHFETNTKNIFSDFQRKYGPGILDNGLTISAGMAYVKSNYPFHYAIDLAEKLCEEGKIVSNRKCSAFSFYKVQESFIDADLNTLRERTQKTFEGDCLYASPYLMKADGNHSTINQLSKNISDFKLLSKDDDRKIAGKFRQWITELHQDRNRASFFLERMEQLAITDSEKCFIKAAREYPGKINDLIQLSSF